jgi:glycosyltransferase involved in cell wall biosynthesis
MTDPGQINADVWVVIPVFNEAQVLEQVVRQTLGVFPNVVCVDDGSGDGSVDAVLRTGAHLVRHPVNLGQGAALQTGLAYARAQPGARYFVMFDADGQHRLEDASAMLRWPAPARRTWCWAPASPSTPPPSRCSSASCCAPRSC